jgi:hypothetical protein
MIFEMFVRDNVLFTRVTVAMLCRFHASEQDVFRDLPQGARRSHANLHETSIASFCLLINHVSGSNR